MHNIIVNRQEHVSLLADHRIDPIIKEIIVVGDEVCVCAKCKTVYLKQVWINFKSETCCNQKQTLSEIPKTEHIDFTKKTIAMQKIKSYRGSYFFFIIIILITFFLSSYFYNESIIWKEKYNLDNNEKNDIRNKLTNAQNELTNAQNELTNAQNIYNKLNSVISNINLVTGIKYDHINKFETSNGNNEAKVYFTVHYPISFKSVSVHAEGSGFLRGYIYDIKNNLICTANNNEITNGLESLVFNCTLNIGKYYMTHTGNTGLLYITNFNKYPIKSNNIITITGTQYEDIFYMNYFEWSYKIEP